LVVIDKKGIAVQIGQNVKRLRLNKNLSMQDLATVAEIEKSQIYRVEHGVFDLKISTLFVLAKALDVEVCDLLSGTKDQTPKDQ